MTTTSAALVPIQSAFTDAERLAFAGFLAGYRGLTREAYALLCRARHKWALGSPFSRSMADTQRATDARR